MYANYAAYACHQNTQRLLTYRLLLNIALLFLKMVDRLDGGGGAGGRKNLWRHA